MNIDICIEFGGKNMIYTLIFIVALLAMSFLTYAIICGKTHILKCELSAYIGILFVPIFLIFYPMVFLKILVEEKFNFLTLILFGIIGIEIFVILVFIFLKINIFPKILKDIKDRYEKGEKSIFYGNKLMKYSIYSCCIYSIPIIGGLYVSIMSGIVSLVYLIVPFFFLFSIPFVVIAVYMITVVSILCGIVVILSVNGVLRLSIGSKNIRKHSVRNIICMFIPVINLICMIHLYKTSKKEFENIEERIVID